MTNVEYFKQQAKNLHKDWQTQFFDKDGDVYDYRPKWFDINSLIVDWDIEEKKKDEFHLMQAQHIIALLIGFKSWADLINAPATELELARLLYDNQDKISKNEWEMYIKDVMYDNKTYFDTEIQVEIFQDVFLNVDGHRAMFSSYRLKENMDESLPDNELDSENSDKSPYDGEVECLHCGSRGNVKDFKHADDCDSPNGWEVIPVK